MYSRYADFIFRSDVVKKICIYDLRVFVGLIFVSFMVFPYLCWADYYIYRDKNGAIHFTDDLADIPEDRLNNIKTYRDLRSPALPEQKPPAKAESPEASNSTKPTASPKTTNHEKDPSLLESLNTRKATLYLERSRFEKELSNLLEKELKLRTKIAVRAHNYKIEEFNDSFAAYRNKRDDFEADWINYYSFVENLPELERLNTRKATLYMERSRLEKELAELVENGQKLRTKMASRVHKRKMKEFISKFTIYQNKRNKFENEWYNFYSSQ
jgi:predicted  nucleic acid-binding Zn-ribbon protein